MNRSCKWNWGILVCVFAIAVGVLHGMTHVEFHDEYSQFLNDTDKLAALSLQYALELAGKMGYNAQTEKLEKVMEHYGHMMARVKPLRELFTNDMVKLARYTENLESIKMTKKFLYSYFRQSAINLINHLKRVYNVDCE